MNESQSDHVLCNNNYPGYLTNGGVSTVMDNSMRDEQGDKTYCMSNYSRETMKLMFVMRSHLMLTDVVLEVQHELFHAHKLVLSAASPYFKAMFTSGLKESEMSRVKLEGACPTAMEKIINFIYTGHIRVTEETVCALLIAATMFQVLHVIDACCDFLKDQLDPTNAIGIANFAEQHGCMTLKQQANQFIERHFTQISTEEEFLQLSANELTQLIRKDELNVQEEREVYYAVLRWIRYDCDRRYPKMEQILYAVRCQFLTPNFLKEQMRTCDVLKKAPACREYLARIFRELTLHKRSVVSERKPNTTRMIFVAGGYFRQSLDILEGYNVDDHMWTALPRLRVPRSGLGAAFLKGTFYAVGGRNNSPGNSYDSDWVDRYNSILEQWRPCAPMSVPRNRVGVAVMDELLYAIGGSSGSEFHNSVECYDPEKDQWTLVQPMHTKRLGVGVAVINRLLYAIGGFDGNERLASMECYHPENNEWTILPSMRIGRSGAGVAALNQYIYVVGGFDGTRQLASVERYDTENEIWDTVSSIRISRSALSLTVLDGKLFAMGGFDGQSFLSIVEVYDPIQNEWLEGTPLTSGRSGHASAVIYQPSCVSSFMDCIDATLNPSKRSQPTPPPPPPPPSDDKHVNPPATSSRNAQSVQSNGLHAFSGNRCHKCDIINDDTVTTMQPVAALTPNQNSVSDSNGNCPLDNLLSMDCDDSQSSASNNMDVESMHIDEQNVNVNNDFNVLNSEHPKRDRRKSNDTAANSSRLTTEPTLSSSNSIPYRELMNRLREKQNECALRQCAFSKLKSRIVAWSSARSNNPSHTEASCSSSSSNTSRQTSRRNDDEDDENDSSGPNSPCKP